MEVPPPCCYLMTKGGVGEVNNPAGGARGGWRSEGDRDFSSRRPGRVEYFQVFLPAFSLATRTSFSVKKALVVDSWWKEKVFKWSWVTGRQFGDFLYIVQCHHFHFSLMLFYLLSWDCSVLDKGSFDLKVLVL